MLGIGIGGVIVPVLIWIFQRHDLPPEIIPHPAIGTSLAYIVFTLLLAIRAQHHRPDQPSGPWLSHSTVISAC